MWILEHVHNSSERIASEFPSKDAGERHLTRMGSVISKYYKLKFESGNALTDRMLTEGMVKGDLYKILLPRISVDEFVPGDPATDNVVVAFFLKGVPEATLPFKTFAEQSNGVISADYGDSETVVGAQNVYCEFDRENLDMEDIDSLMIQAAMLAGIEEDDFTMTFPHTDKKFPYDTDIMREYFISRNEQKNRIAQERALSKAADEFESDLQDARDKQQQEVAANQDQEQTEKQPEQQSPEDEFDQELAQESLIKRMAGVSLTG